MSQPIPDYLRLHVEDSLAVIPPACNSTDALERFCQSFRDATGWALKHGDGPAPLQSPDVLWARTLSHQGEHASHLAIHRTPGKLPRDLQNELLPLCELVDSMADLVGQLAQTRRALIEREAELAAGIPLVSHGADEQHLAVQLQAILRGGASAARAQAAALYVLDDATSQLKLRSTWGLPDDRFLAPARPLRGAVADLEALTGHAVAIDDVRLLPHWNVPEAYAAALCVPVSSPSTPLGTLWIFCDQVREFDDHQTEIIEIIAGRIAAELERHILLQAVSGQRDPACDDQRLLHIHDEQLPIGPIETDHWQVAALCHQGRHGGSDAYDWHMHEDGSATVALVSAGDADVNAAMTLQLIRGAAKAAMLADASPQALVRSVADVAWTSTTGQCQASLGVARLPACDGQIEFCSAGPLGALIVRADRPTAIGQGSPALAADPDAAYRGAPHRVAAGEVVVLLSDSVRKAVNNAGEQLGEAAIADCVRENLHHDAEQITHLLFDLWRHHTDDPQRSATILIAKRAADAC